MGSVSYSTDGINWIPINGVTHAELEWELSKSEDIPLNFGSFDCSIEFHTTRRQMQHMYRVFNKPHGMRREKRRARKRRGK